MGFVPDITEGLPALVSARRQSSAGEARGVLYDVVISGIGLTFAIDSQNPYLRESVAVQKQQIDTSPEAGEQSLENGWVRSQTSWHRGSGAAFYEPGSRDDDAGVSSRFRFADSRGVDVWERGEITLLPRMDKVDSGAATVSVCGARLPTGEDVWYSRVGTTIYRHVGLTTINQGSNADIGGRLAPAGSRILIGSTKGVYTTSLTGSSVTALITRAAGVMCQPYWVKSRVVVTTGPQVYQVPPVSGVLDSTNLLWTHPDSAWTWSGVAETPDAILMSGHSGGQSCIYAMTLSEDTSGSVPKLSQPIQVSELPPGEEITSIQSYLGRYLGIGTTAGIRVGVIGTGGQVQYGPLLAETTSPVVALGARDSFLYAATAHSVIRVDLSESIDDGLRFPYAYDVELPTGKTISSLAFVGTTSRVVAGCDGDGAYVASATERISSGWLESGDIRFSTTAPKAFRTMDVEADTPTDTSVAISAVVSGVEQTLVTLAQGSSGLDIGLGSLPSPLGQLRYRLQLAGGPKTPTVKAVSVRAVPAPKRQRLIQYPVQCADHMRDSKNAPFGRDGYAATLLAAMENLENDSGVVTVVDHTRPEQFDATIEKVEFARVEPRSRGGDPNFGGVMKITVRTL